MNRKVVFSLFLLFGICLYGILSYQYRTDPYGHPIKWRKTSISISYKIDAAGTPDCAGEHGAIQQAFEVWDNASGMNWIFSGYGSFSPSDWSVDNGININVWCETDWAAITGTGSGTIALCNYWYAYNLSSVWLTDADIIYNGENFIWSSTGETGKMDVQNIATHEAGHALVLLDINEAGDTEKTMYGYSSAGETKKRTLEQDDIDGARFLYLTPTPMAGIMIYGEE